MKLLEERILKDGKAVGHDVLKVDKFLNHQLDPSLFLEMGMEWRRLFPEEVTKILTIEASGIGLSTMAAYVFQVPAVFAKKSRTKNITGSVYTARVESFTHAATYTIMVSKEFLTKEDKVLILDDFLANGSALEGLIDLVRQSGATLVGAGVAVEKTFQPGGERIRQQGIHLESLAKIKSFNPDGTVQFC